jgi:hypothetical protein
MMDVSFIYISFNDTVNSSLYILPNFRKNFAYESDFHSMAGGLVARQPSL